MIVEPVVVDRTIRDDVEQGHEFEYGSEQTQQSSQAWEELTEHL